MTSSLVLTRVTYKITTFRYPSSAISSFVLHFFLLDFFLPYVPQNVAMVRWVSGKKHAKSKETLTVLLKIWSWSRRFQSMTECCWWERSYRYFRNYFPSAVMSVWVSALIDWSYRATFYYHRCCWGSWITMNLWSYADFVVTLKQGWKSLSTHKQTAFLAAKQLM